MAEAAEANIRTGGNRGRISLQRQHRANIATIPTNWTLGHLSDAIQVVRGGFSVNCEDREALAGELGVLKTGAVLNGVLDTSENKFVPPEEHSRLRTPIKKGTIIFCRKNSEDVIGAAALADEEYDHLYLSDLLWAITPSREVNGRWLLYVLHNESTRQMIRIQATGTQSSMKNISQDRLLGIPVIVPPRFEQDRIVDLLESWDQALKKMDALLLAKRKRFKAIARRFFDPCHPSFGEHPDNWHEWALGELFSERSEPGQPGDRLLSITMREGVVDRDEVGRRDTSPEDKSNYKLILPGDIGYNTMRMWQGVSSLSCVRGIVSPAYTVVTPQPRKIDGRYAAHLFKSSRMVFDFERFSQGLTSDTWNLKFPAFSKIRVFLPNIDEQERRANILDQLQAEIALLGRQSDAFARQRCGLMQKVLSGEWKVKP